VLRWGAGAVLCVLLSVALLAGLVYTPAFFCDQRRLPLACTHQLSYVISVVYTLHFARMAPVRFMLTE